MIQQIIRYLRQLESRQLYFWIGFISGALFWWLASKLRILLPQVRNRVRMQITETRKSLATSTEARLCNDTLRHAQRMHLASSLFALDEIVIPPRLMAPPPPPHTEGDETDAGGIDTIIPYLPDWPELAATYHAPTLSFPDALKGGANLILTGVPGSGKTVALAYLACQIARRSAEVGDLAEFLPILVHTVDIHLPSEPPSEPLQPLIDAIAQNVSTLTLPRLPGLVRGSFEHGSALLLLDGLDELPPDSVTQISAYLGTILKNYPTARMVVAAAPEYYDGLAAFGMIPVPIAAWDELDRANFIRHWGDMWHRFIVPLLPEGSNGTDPLLLNGWLLSPDASATPLELTLKTWAAYAGDISGPGASDAIEAFLLRMTAGIPKARPVLEKIALQMVLGTNPVISVKETQKWVPDIPASVSPFEESAPPFEEELPLEETVGAIETVQPDSPAKPAGTTTTEPSGPEKKKEAASKPASQAFATTQQVFFRLVESGVMVARRDSLINFAHPVLAGYLAGTALASSGEIEKLSNQPDWTGKALAMRYLSHWNDLTDLALPMLEEKGDPLFRKLVTACRWLRDTSKTARWRTLSMRHLTSILQKELLPMGLRARALTALIYSNDPGVSVLLRSLLASHMLSVRRLAALGCGLAQDTKSVKDLANLLEDPEYSVRQAALLALVAISTKPSMDVVATQLLRGTEDMRRAAAEALANHPEEGHPALSDGSSMPDVLVRRAVVYGLARLNQPWAIQILEKMQVEDEQWVVRTAATQALEELRKPNPRIPRPLPPLQEMPWLILYAGKQGLGVTPGKPALDLVVSALRSQDKKEQLAAIYTLTYRGEGMFAHNLYQLLYGGETELQDAAYISLWQISASGASLPPPTQFGFVF